MDRRRRQTLADLRAAMRRARLAHGTSYLDQLREVLLLGMWQHGPEPLEYYLYGLCDHRRHDRQDRRAFVGGRRPWGRGPLPLSPRVTSKLGFERMMREHGLPATLTLARYGGGGPPAGVRHLPDAPALGRFLREAADRRLFGKPLPGSAGSCALAIEGWEPATDSVRAGPAGGVAVLKLQRLLQPFAGSGYLLQAALSPHPELAPVLGGRISTVRALVRRTGAEAFLDRAAWKIPAAGNVADGFWTPGNLLGAVDPDTGRVWRVVDDFHPRQRLIADHPDSGLPLHHRTLPDWTMLRATVLAAAELFPASPCLAFDVALTDDGPVLTGLEDGAGDPVLLQLAHDRGLGQEQPAAGVAASAGRVA
ncbi:MAG TPA: sugar-transfer associated ATP-grasp domain-containing protein [Geminicoccaceae bacterium]|nr:sugar-transfer associated ATP-grasp domain-containing protein [Geminicoccus sp.]HMU49724.1 sugar-transfer associated ATP-grasp domain-containing protein [Geminicoccaceae bacterium]